MCCTRLFFFAVTACEKSGREGKSKTLTAFEEPWDVSAIGMILIHGRSHSFPFDVLKSLILDHRPIMIIWQIAIRLFVIVVVGVVCVGGWGGVGVKRATSNCVYFFEWISKG